MDLEEIEIEIGQKSILLKAFYNFTVTGDSLSDPYLRLYDTNSQIKQNDDHDGSL